MSKTSAKLWSFLKPTGWNSAGGFAGKVQREPCFLIAPSRLGANSLVFLGWSVHPGAAGLQEEDEDLGMERGMRWERGAGEPRPGAGH